MVNGLEPTGLAELARKRMRELEDAAARHREARRARIARKVRFDARRRRRRGE